MGLKTLRRDGEGYVRGTDPVTLQIRRIGLEQVVVQSKPTLAQRVAVVVMKLVK